MEREETLAAWWASVHETSRVALYLLVECLRLMGVGKTFELWWRDSAKKRFLEGRVVSEEAGEPEIQGTRAEPQGRGTVQAATCRETVEPSSITCVHPDGRVEVVVPKVSDEQVNGWWHHLNLDSKDTMRMLITWLQELKGRDMVRIKKLPGELQFSRSRSRGPARADGSDW